MKTEPKDEPMGLFKADLYRNFAIGFVVGAMIVGAGATNLPGALATIFTL